MIIRWGGRQDEVILLYESLAEIKILGAVVPKEKSRVIYPIDSNALLLNDIKCDIICRLLQ